MPTLGEDSEPVEVTVPAGEHMVELRYAPRGFRFGVWIAIATLAALLVTTFVRWRSRGTAENCPRRSRTL